MGRRLAYDPARVAALRERAIAVAAQLTNARSDDPAAAGAMQARRIVLSRLEDEWLPAIDRVVRSDAMTSWTSTGADAEGAATSWWAWLLELVRPRSGSELGALLVGAARRVVADGELDDIEALQRMLRADRVDDEALRALFTDLGTDDLMALLVRLGDNDQDPTYLDVARLVRAGLVRATTNGSLPPTHGAAIVRSASDAHLATGRSGSAAVALSFLFHGEQLPGPFVVDAVGALHAAEDAFAAAEDLDPSIGWELWGIQPWGLWSGLLADFAGDEDHDVYDRYFATDPIYAVLDQLGRDGAAGRAVFTDPREAAYLFRDRWLLQDDGLRIVTAAATASAGPDVVAGADPAVLEDATYVASAFVNVFGDAHAPELLGGRDDRVATAVATVLGKHMHSVHVTMTTDAVDDDATPAGVVPFEHEAFGDGVVGLRASFDRGALESMMDLAVDSEDGVWTLRDWLNRYQADLAAVAVQRIAVGDITVARGVNTFLLEQMADAADLEGRWVEHVGHRAEHRGRDRDRELSFWIDAAGTAVSLGGSLFGGPLTSAVIGVAVDPVGDGFAALFADHQERARADAESLAADAAQQLTYSWLRELYDQGVVTPDLPPELVPGGELPDYATLQELLGQLRAAHPERTDLTVERILVAMDETTGRRGTNLDIRAVLAAVKVAQLDHYERLD